MRFPLCFLLGWLLCACDSPSPAFSGAEASRHEVGSNTFSVYVKNGQAQSIRTNFAKRPDIRSVARQAETAKEAASGCPVVKIYGDVALLNGTLDCSQPIRPNEWAVWSKPPRRGMTCVGESSASRRGDWRDVTLDCF